MKDTRSLKSPATLSIDIGGSAIKMMVLNEEGLSLSDYMQETTPNPATIDSVCDLISKMLDRLTVKFHRISTGFPGVIQRGVIKTAHNMHPSWLNINFEKKLQEITNCDARVANDADIQGLGTISGKGMELVITLGTGIGSALFINGTLVPNLELGHHPFKDKKTYEELLSKDSIIKNGSLVWHDNLKEAIQLWKKTYNYDKLYLGGGCANNITFKLPDDVEITDNIRGVLGGIFLWRN